MSALASLVEFNNDLVRQREIVLGQRCLVDDLKRAIQPQLMRVFADNGLPDGIMGLTRPMIIDPTAAYFEVNLEHTRSDGTNEVLARRVTIVQTDAGPRAFDPDYGEDLGSLPEMATMPFNQWRGRYPGEMHGAYNGFVMGSPHYREIGYRSRFVFPLSGPALRHPAYARLAAFADELTKGQNDALETLLEADAQLKLHEIRAQSIRSHCEAIIEDARLDAKAADKEPHKVDPDLAKLMTTAEWDNRMADEWLARRLEIQKSVVTRLASLDPDVAVAFLSLAGANWHVVLSRLIEHRLPQGSDFTQ